MILGQMKTKMSYLRKKSQNLTFKEFGIRLEVLEFLKMKLTLKVVLDEEILKLTVKIKERKTSLKNKVYLKESLFQCQGLETATRIIMVSIHLSQCHQKRRRWGLINYGQKQDVTTINCDFKQDFRKWLNKTYEKWWLMILMMMTMMKAKSLRTHLKSSGTLLIQRRTLALFGTSLLHCWLFITWLFFLI